MGIGIAILSVGLILTSLGAAFLARPSLLMAIGHDNAELRRASLLPESLKFILIPVPVGMVVLGLIWTGIGAALIID